MQQRIEIISQMAGIEPGIPVNEAQITMLVQIILHDIMHYIHHVNSGKYDLSTAINRIETLIKQDYDLK